MYHIPKKYMHTLCIIFLTKTAAQLLVARDLLFKNNVAKQPVSKLIFKKKKKKTVSKITTVLS